MNKFRSKYVKHIVKNSKMLNKTKLLEKLYNIYLLKPNIKNKTNWLNIMKGD